VSEEFESFRMGHLVRTAGIWKRLVELGATEESPLDFDFHFSAKSAGAVETLKSALGTYKLKVSSSGVLRKSYDISGSSGKIPWSEKQLLQWVDYLINVGVECDCEFSGCGANAPNGAA
jgi:hypothetical protein